MSLCLHGVEVAFHEGHLDQEGRCQARTGRCHRRKEKHQSPWPGGWESP